MNILETLKADYQRFPQNQTYSIYAKDVYFEDPMNRFYGAEKYQRMIGFMDRWFIDLKLDLHQIEQVGDIIHTRWTLTWTISLPWRPRVAIAGYSELRLNQDGLICSHIDYWTCSRLDVIKQIFWPKFRTD